MIIVLEINHNLIILRLFTKLLDCNITAAPMFYTRKGALDCKTHRLKQFFAYVSALTPIMIHLI